MRHDEGPRVHTCRRQRVRSPRRPLDVVQVGLPRGLDHEHHVAATDTGIDQRVRELHVFSLDVTERPDQPFEALGVDEPDGGGQTSGHESARVHLHASLEREPLDVAEVALECAEPLLDGRLEAGQALLGPGLGLGQLLQALLGPGLGLGQLLQALLGPGLGLGQPLEAGVDATNQIGELEELVAEEHRPNLSA